MLYRSKMFPIGLPAGILSTLVFLGVVPAPATTAPTNSSPVLPPLILSGRQSARPAGTFSAGVAEIVKMLDAKVETEVLLSYVQTSPIAYNPDATELIALKEHGASPEILTAILHHGDELRLRLAQAETSANPQPAASAYVYPPDTVPVASGTGSYPESGGPAYPGGYYGYGYGYRARGLYGSSTSNGCRPWYDYGHWWAPFFDNGHHYANENPSTWDTAASKVKQPPFSGYVVSSGHTAARQVHSSVSHVAAGAAVRRPPSQSH